MPILDLTPLQIKQMSSFFLLGGGVADPPPNKNQNTFFFDEKKKVWAGPGLPGQALAWYLSSTSHSWRLRQRPTWLKRSTGADLKGGLGGAKPPQEKKYKLFWCCLNLGERWAPFTFQELSQW